jgi:hypothetical protein
MKRVIASGVGVLALGAFLAYQPVAGSSSDGGLTRSPSPVTEPKVSRTTSADVSAPTHPAPSPTPLSISGGRKDADDREGEEEHHREREHHDDQEFESDDD